MESLSFFYNMLIMAAFIFCCINFFVLYNKYKDKHLLCFAIVFLLFIMDNLLLYMNEFLPGFANYYENILNTKPYIANVMATIICFSYRLTFVSYEEKPMTEKEIVLWFLVGFAQIVSSLAYVYLLGKIISNLLFAIVSLGTFGAAVYRIKKKGPFPTAPNIPHLSLRFVVSSLFLELAVNVERVLNEVGIQIVHDRIISIELLSIFFTFSAISYIIRVFENSEGFVPASDNDQETNEIERLERFCEEYGLTSRERDILIYLVKGYSNAQICEEACIAQGTVKSHTHNIYQKIGVSNRLQLVVKLKEF